MERNRIDRRKVPSGAAVMRADVTDALVRAFFEEWAERGYASLSLEAVAKRAGAGKAALYRRWPSKAAMSRDALGLVGLELTAIADHGSLDGDMRALLRSMRRAMRHPLLRRILPDLNAELVRSPDFAAMVQPFQRARRERSGAMLRRAVERGELPATLDVELANDLLIAPLYWRMLVVPGHADANFVERLTRVVIAGLRAAG